jgi:hypothetical protein
MSRSPLATRAVPPALLLAGDRGREEIVGLVSGRLRVHEAAGGHQLRQCVELLKQRVVELAPALVGGKLLVPVGRRVESVPADEHGAGLFGLVEAQQKIPEPEDGAGRPAALAQDRLRQCVIGAMCEEVAVDDQQRPALRTRFLRRNGSFGSG